MRAEALFFFVQLGTELHQRDCLEVLRHERVRARQANEYPGRPGRDVDLVRGILQAIGVVAPLLSVVGAIGAKEYTATSPLIYFIGTLFLSMSTRVVFL